MSAYLWVEQSEVRELFDEGLVVEIAGAANVELGEEAGGLILAELEVHVLEGCSEVWGRKRGEKRGERERGEKGEEEEEREGEQRREEKREKKEKGKGTGGEGRGEERREEKRREEEMRGEERYS